MRSRLRTADALRAVAFVLAAALLAAAPAFAASLDDAKAAGQVGEQIDGYVGLVKKGAPDDVKNLVEEVNAKRRSKYESIAKKNGTSAKAVAALAGSKLVKRAEKGEFVKDASGEWKQK